MVLELLCIFIKSKQKKCYFGRYFFNSISISFINYSNFQRSLLQNHQHSISNTIHKYKTSKTTFMG